MRTKFLKNLYENVPISIQSIMEVRKFEIWN